MLTDHDWLYQLKASSRQVGNQTREMNMCELSKDLRDAANQTPVLVADLRKLVRYLVELCGECVDMADECAFTDLVARLVELKEVARKLGALK